MTDTNEQLRSLPAVGVVLARPAAREAIARHGHAVVARAGREAIADARKLFAAGMKAEVSDADVVQRAAAIARGSLRSVINATGVIVHTNLGRAPLADEAVEAMNEVARGYTSLEYDLEKGARGERHGHARELLLELTGADDAVVVNNNAGAVLLALAATARGREVIVSRGELVEIGGGFRIPDVLAQSGAKLVEVGTTNRTHARDYEQAMSDDTALVLKVHRSNFAIVGFTSEVSVKQLATLAHARKVPLAYDAGSGCLTDDLATKEEPTVRSLIGDGADLVTFSGDKLLGGPQAGIVVGRAALVDSIRRHPLMRALRPDKLCIAALVATLKLWRDAPDTIPIFRFATVAPEELEKRAKRIAGALSAEAVQTIARLGGGSAPLREIESWGVRLRSGDADALAARLRGYERPIIARIEDDAVILDLRCILPEHDELLVRAVTEADG